MSQMEIGRLEMLRRNALHHHIVPSVEERKDIVVRFQRNPPPCRPQKFLVVVLLPCLLEGGPRGSVRFFSAAAGLFGQSLDVRLEPLHKFVVGRYLPVSVLGAQYGKVLRRDEREFDPADGRGEIVRRGVLGHGDGIGRRISSGVLSASAFSSSAVIARITLGAGIVLDRLRDGLWDRNGVGMLFSWNGVVTRRLVGPGVGRGEVRRRGLLLRLRGGGVVAIIPYGGSSGEIDRSAVLTLIRYALGHDVRLVVGGGGIRGGLLRH
mmetsp:Transcript_30103/g.89555  ORF Transcript_30103/g.89555 Transcript_30103/m.89555 type:complete len:265 (-) Transcript_30103:464-1258(-)